MAIAEVKICCISSLEEAQLAIDAGAAALGLVGPMPSGPGVISLELAAEIAATVPKHIQTFLLTSATTTEGILAEYAQVRPTTLQLVDAQTEATYEALRAALPNVRLVQVVHVTGPESAGHARHYARLADALLLDSGGFGSNVLGGTGNTHDWSVSNAICEAVDVPVYLAGGLKPDNVAEAIDSVQPYGLDLCSGVRSDGALDAGRLKAFFAAAAGEKS